MESNKWVLWLVGVVIVLGLGYVAFIQKQPAAQPVQAPQEEVKGEETPQEKGEVKIGVIVPLTGDVAVIGVPISRAVSLAAEEINALGGIGGKTLVLVMEDGKCDGREASTAAQRLINVEHVSAIVGGACSGETLGFAPIVNENKVVTISPSATSPDITTHGGEYVFRTAPSDGMAGSVAAQFALRDLGAKKAAILSENTEYAQGLRNIFSQTFTKDGGEVVFDESYNTGVTDFRTQVLKMKNARPDVVYIVPQSPAPGVAVMKALNDQQVPGARMTAEVLIGEQTVKDNPDVLEGLIGFEAYFDRSSPAVEAFSQAYKTAYDEDLPYPFFQAGAYSIVYLLKSVIEQYGTDGQKLQQALHALTNWQGGALANVTFDQNGDIVWRDFQVRRVTSGALENVKVFQVQ